jgi:hypothetical protein
MAFEIVYSQVPTDLLHQPSHCGDPMFPGLEEPLLCQNKIEALDRLCSGGIAPSAAIFRPTLNVEHKHQSPCHIEK